MTDSLERGARGAADSHAVGEHDLGHRSAQQSTDIVGRFLAARRQAAPEVATFLAAAAIAATSALAPSNAHAQAVARAERTSATERAFHGNTSFPDPPASGKAPRSVLLDLTGNTMVWLDADGAATNAPEDFALAYDAPVKVVGSYAARYPMHDRVLAAAMAAETTRVMLSRNRESSLLQVQLIRGAPGDPQGFPHSPGQPLNPASGEPHAVRGAHPVAPPPVSSAPRRSSADVVIERAASMPDRVVTGEANSAIAQVESALRSDIHAAVTRAIGKVIRPRR